ncbi:MAG: hypothetical protein E7679_03150 [Ruminococcaceae bacterium]|nr:hypothetical protein [Oscillospiraceae bacterium]
MITLISVSIVCGIVHILAPAGTGEGIRKHVKLISSLCVLCIMIAPISGFIRSLESSEFNILGEYKESGSLENRYDKIYNDMISAYSAEQIAERCEEILRERFSLEEGDIQVMIYFSSSDNEPVISKAAVILYTGAITKDPREISACVTELLECECEIIYR